MAAILLCRRLQRAQLLDTLQLHSRCDVMVLLLLLPSAGKLLLPLHVLDGLPEPKGRLRVTSPGGSFPILQSARARDPRVGRELWLQLNKNQGSAGLRAPV